MDTDHIPVTPTKRNVEFCCAVLYCSSVLETYTSDTKTKNHGAIFRLPVMIGKILYLYFRRSIILRLRSLRVENLYRFEFSISLSVAFHFHSIWGEHKLVAPRAQSNFVSKTVFEPFLHCLFQSKR